MVEVVMDKFPLLEQLRAENERRESETAAPLRNIIYHLQQRVSSLETRLRSLERALGSEIAGHVVEMVAAGVAAELRRKIMETMSKAMGSAEPVTLTLNADVVRFMDPRSLEREILDRYAAHSLPDLRLDAMPDPANAVTVLDIRIPELCSRFAMADLH